MLDRTVYSWISLGWMIGVRTGHSRINNVSTNNIIETLIYQQQRRSRKLRKRGRLNQPNFKRDFGRCRCEGVQKGRPWIPKLSFFDKVSIHHQSSAKTDNIRHWLMWRELQIKIADGIGLWTLYMTITMVPTLDDHHTTCIPNYVNTHHSICGITLSETGTFCTASDTSDTDHDLVFDFQIRLTMWKWDVAMKVMGLL